ncbi:13E12 repeat family protein [Brachybacterium squillarum]|uniref:13E12 repeat family protein n=1 Tax=Brachybacterium squillarum TaxID=661979 RepID=UPI002222168E|nr:13E12 repeat family protein [Brachybacterium squillarum]MCW1804677.1 13E12 repeat family protein [Brachybacterium squillarum]
MTVTRPHGSAPSDGERPQRAEHPDHTGVHDDPGSAALSHRFRRPPRGRSHVTAENLAAKGDLEEDSAEAVVLRRVLERRRTVHAHLYIEELRDLASLWDGASGDDGGNGIAAGLVLRSRIGRATRRLHDAYIGVTDLPECLARVETGDLPTEWFDQLVRAVRDLPGAQRRQVDETVAGWRVESLSPDRFRTLVKHLVTWLDPEVGAGGDPDSRRDVFLEHAPAPDGTAFLTIVGPIPEILDLSTRLDRPPARCRTRSGTPSSGSPPVARTSRSPGTGTGRSPRAGGRCRCGHSATCCSRAARSRPTGSRSRRCRCG